MLFLKENYEGKKKNFLWQAFAALEIKKYSICHWSCVLNVVFFPLRRRPHLPLPGLLREALAANIGAAVQVSASITHCNFFVHFSGNCDFLLFSRYVDSEGERFVVYAIYMAGRHLCSR